MINYPRSEIVASPLKVRFLGVGNAGVHIADRLLVGGSGDIDIVVLNTDAQSLASSIVPRKIALGQRATRGLGTGGDPEVAYEAAQESLSDIRDALEGANLVFLCGGLGGGTASGVLPLLAEAANENGAVVISLVTTPFAFEGKRRSQQAVEALAGLRRHSQGVIHFANDRMAEMVSPRTGIEETFAVSDSFLCDCASSLFEVLKGGKPLPIGLSELLSATHGGSALSLFGRGEATGDNRAHEALERALKSPLLDRGRLIAESHAVVVQISGPTNLSFAEFSVVMQDLGKQVNESAQLFFGVTIRPEHQAPVSVTILGNYAGAEAAQSIPVSTPAPAARPRRVAEPAPAVAREEPRAAAPEAPLPPLFPEHVSPEAPEEKPAAVPVASVAPPPSRDTRSVQPPPAAPPAPKVKQETLQFEPVARGRFEKIEPTIVEGEDLDVPTFLRARGKVK